MSVDNKLSSSGPFKAEVCESVAAAGQSQVAAECPKKSAQAFLGDNANLVNLDNLISFPSSSPSSEFVALMLLMLMCCCL